MTFYSPANPPPSDPPVQYDAHGHVYPHMSIDSVCMCNCVKCTQVVPARPGTDEQTLSFCLCAICDTDACKLHSVGSPYVKGTVPRGAAHLTPEQYAVRAQFEYLILSMDRAMPAWREHFKLVHKENEHDVTG